jgi:hypothetical protein
MGQAIAGATHKEKSADGPKRDSHDDSTVFIRPE